MENLLQELRKNYTDAYRPSPLSDYAKTYAPIESSESIAEACSDDNYTGAYAFLIVNPVTGGAYSG